MAEESYFIGIDPGLGGAYSVITQKDGKVIDAKVYGVPVIKTKATGKAKAKNEYNVKLISEILRPYQGKNVLVCLEKVSAMPGQGTVSMFHFGEGFGIWKGIIGCLGFELKLITPLTWKTEWPEDLLKKLDKPDILKLKPIEVNRLSATDRKKHKDAKKQYKQDMDKAKKLAKDKARELAGKLYPELKECFELKKDDGKAESLLIAEYIRRHANG